MPSCITSLHICCRAHGPGLCKPCQTQTTYDSSTIVQKRYSIWILKKQSQVYLCDVLETNNEIVVFELARDQFASHCSNKIVSKVAEHSGSDQCLDSIVCGVPRGTGSSKGYSLQVASKLSENNVANSSVLANDSIADNLRDNVVCEAAGDGSAGCCNVAIKVDECNVAGYSPGNVVTQVIVDSVPGNHPDSVLFEVVGDGLEDYCPDTVFDLPGDSGASNCPDSSLFDVIGAGFEGYSPDAVFDLAEDISGYCSDKVVLEVVGSSFESYSHDAGFDLAANSVAGYYPDNMVTELTDDGVTGNFSNCTASELLEENVSECYHDNRPIVSKLPQESVLVQYPDNSLPEMHEITDACKCDTVPQIGDGDQCTGNTMSKLYLKSDAGDCPDYRLSELLKDNVVDKYYCFRLIESKQPEDGAADNTVPELLEDIVVVQCPDDTVPKLTKDSVVGLCPDSTVPKLPEDNVVGLCPDNTVPKLTNDSVVGQCPDSTVPKLPKDSVIDQCPGTKLSKLYEIDDTCHYHYMVSELLKDSAADNFIESRQITSELSEDCVEGRCTDNTVSKLQELVGKGPESMATELLEVGVPGQCLGSTVSAMPGNSVLGQRPNKVLDNNVAGIPVSELPGDCVANKCPNQTLLELHEDQVGGQCTDAVLAKDNVLGQSPNNTVPVSELIESNVEDQCHDNVASVLPKDNAARQYPIRTVLELPEGNVALQCTNSIVLELPAIDVDVSPKARVSGLTEMRFPGNTVLEFFEIVEAGQCIGSRVSENLVTVQCSDITVSERSGNFATGPCLGDAVPELVENHVTVQCLDNSVFKESDINDGDRNKCAGNAVSDLPEISIVCQYSDYVSSKSELPEKSVAVQCLDDTVSEMAAISDTVQSRNTVLEQGGVCAATRCASTKLSERFTVRSVNASSISPTLGCVEQSNKTEVFSQSSNPQMGSVTAKYLRGLLSKKSFNSFFYKYRRNSRGIYKLKRIPSNHVLRCPFCPKHFRGIFMLQVHCRFHSGITPFYCKFCGMRYRLCSSLKVHLSHCKCNESKLVLQHPLKKGDGECYECTLCGKKYKTKAGLKEHVRSHVGKARKKLKCKVCGCKFSRKGELLTHALSHKEQDLYVCDICQKICLNKRDLVEHQICHSNDRPFRCSDCGASYKRKSHLTRHEAAHTNKSCRVEEPDIEASVGCPYKCSHCGRPWSTARLLETHEATHVDQRVHVCNLCDRRFVQLGALKRHTSTVHGGVKRFECETCGMRFTTKVTRDNHVLIHSGQKPFSCEACEKAFRTRQQLKLHEAIHSEVRPFVCGRCGRSFRRRPHLVIHQRTHTGEKPYVCPVCSHAYAQKNDMRKHLRSRHAQV